MPPDLESAFMPLLARKVFLRPDTSDQQTFRDVQWQSGEYHRPPATMPAPRSILDLGSNIGLTAAHYKTLWPRAEVVAVEMDEDNCAVARQNLEGTGVTVIRSAVAGRTGWRRYRGYECEAFTLTPDVFKSEPAGSGVVMGSRMYDLLAAFDGRGCDFVKMDVEGAEWEVFEDGLGYDGSCAWAPLVQNLLVELHPGGPDDLPDDSEVLLAVGIEKLTGLGFQAEHHRPHPRAVWAWR